MDNIKEEISFKTEVDEIHNIKLDEIWKKTRQSSSSENNGGKTDYYQLNSCPFKINDFDDFAEWRKMNGNQFNIGKVVWTFNQGRHDGTSYERDLYKIIHYANRELLRIRREKC